jgi:hypothetical protein
MNDKPKLSRNLAALPNVSKLLALVEKLETRHVSLDGLGVMHGRPGLGKTSAGAASAVLQGALHLVVESMVTPRSLLEMIAENMGVRHPKKCPNNVLFRMVAHAREESGRTLILDEADRLMKTSLIELVRDLYDQTKAPIVLIGEEDLPQELLRWPRVHSRVLAWSGVEDATAMDVDLLAPVHLPGIEITADLKAALLVGSGHNHRYIVGNMAAIADAARVKGLRRMTLADWGDGVFYGGKAPVPRSLPAHKQRPSRVRRAA